MSKKILKESTIRSFMKLANLGKLSDDFVNKLNEDGEPLLDETWSYDEDEGATASPAMEEAEEVEMGADVEMEEEPLEEPLEDPLEEPLEEPMEEPEEAEGELNITREQAEVIIELADQLRGMLGEPEEEEPLEEPEMPEEEPLEEPEGDEDVEMGAEVEAEEELEAQTGHKTLDERLENAGITEATISANAVLDRIKSSRS